ncbi:MAG: hypothetical protein AAF483_30770 [Planctomycetota bacterium]
MVQKGSSKGKVIQITRSSKIDFQRGLLLQSWLWEIEGEPKFEKKSAMKLYMPNRIAELLVDTGFESLRFLGDANSSPYQIDSLRLIVIAERPE